jgi:tRNA1Val (adenine37-N6)-methyltransferase
VSDDPLTDDAITSRFRIWQRVRGHRYSLDDVVVAWEAAHAAPSARTAIDLGTGIGSVLHMLAHALPEARLAAVEAQDVSFDLLERNLARNGLTERARVHHGDLRDVAAYAHLGGAFDLVTGTPPYFPAASCTLPPDSQRAHARVELRGGIEDYLRAASSLVADDGVVVICGDAQKPDRVMDGAASCGLHPRTRRDVVPREGKKALVGVWTLRKEAGALVHHPDLVARDAGGARTAIQHSLRGFFGLSIAPEAPSPRALTTPARRATRRT